MARPKKYKKEFDEQAEKLCIIYGSDDKKLAQFFDVNVATINRWKNEFEKFCESIKRGKDVYDTEHVEVSLRERACGYEHPEEKVFCQDGKIITHQQIKHYPPETTAAIFWLKNRHPGRWKDVKRTEMGGIDGEPIKHEITLRSVKAKK
jgi:hypothetical protein